MAGSIVQACALMALVVVGGVLIVDVEGNRAGNVSASRDFYGTLAVYSVDSQNLERHYYMLRHGQIIHGEQFTAADKRLSPTTYYGPDSGVGLVMLDHPRRFAPDPRDRSLRVGAIGLGVGTIAAYGMPGDDIRFYEINPAVIRIAAADNSYFTYISGIRSRKSRSCVAMRGYRWNENWLVELRLHSTTWYSTHSPATPFRCIC
jgi:hypothetical protein